MSREILSFAYPNENGAVRFVVDGYLPDEREYIKNTVESFIEQQKDLLAFAFTLRDGCLLVRTYDKGVYSFVYPIVCREGADVAASVKAIRDYALREELPLIFTDVPAEELGALVSLFRHCNVDADSPDASSFRVEVKTECRLLDKIPRLSSSGLMLSQIETFDKMNYSRLCTDSKTNKYWGYDYRDDHGILVPSGFFIEEARRAFLNGTALSLALRSVKNTRGLIGEVVFYAFDGSGAAELAIRLLPEYRGQGFGKKALPLCFKYARRIGLVRVKATVDKRNASSLALFADGMEKCDEDDAAVHFSVSLY